MLSSTLKIVLVGKVPRHDFKSHKSCTLSIQRRYISHIIEHSLFSLVVFNLTRFYDMHGTSAWDL